MRYAGESGLGFDIGSLITDVTDVFTLPPEQPSGMPDNSIYGVLQQAAVTTGQTFWPSETTSPTVPGATAGTSFWDNLLNTVVPIAATYLLPKPKPTAVKPGTYPPGYRPPVATAGIGGVNPWLIAGGVVAVALVMNKRGGRRRRR